jgi:hypothetical protein
VFEGGLIMPGEGLMLRSLSSGTAQLPSLTYWPASIPPPLVGLSVRLCCPLLSARSSLRDLTRGCPLRRPRRPSARACDICT